MNHKKIALISLLMLLLSSMSGCIHIELGKDTLGERKRTVEFVEVEKAVIKNYFDTELFNPESYTYYGHNTTEVVLSTKWIKVYIKVVIEPLPADLPIPLPEDVSRFVHLTVTMPDGINWIDKEYTESTEETLTINTPYPGLWEFTIDAAGYGTNTISYHDGFTIVVKTLEPK